MAQGEKLYRAGIIGCGTIAKAHARAYSEHAKTEVAALSDIRREAAEALAKEHGVGAGSCYDDGEEMLSSESLDIVSVCTWPGLHAPMVVAAAQAGAKAVICEKPLAPDLAQVDQMLDACKQSGTKLIVSHQHRFNPARVTARQLVREGAVGEPQLIHLGSGRGLLNNGSHALDSVRFMLDDPKWEWVVAQVQRKTDRYERGGRIEDLVGAIVGLAGGCRVVFESDLPPMPMEGTRIYGSEGVLEVTWKDVRLLAGKDSTDGRPWHEVEIPESPSSHVAQLDELVSWIEGGPGHRGDAREHRHTIELLMGIYESARRRGMVEPPVPSGPSPLEEMIESGELAVEVEGRVDLPI